MQIVIKRANADRYRAVFVDGQHVGFVQHVFDLMGQGQWEYADVDSGEMTSGGILYDWDMPTLSLAEMRTAIEKLIRERSTAAQ